MSKGSLTDLRNACIIVAAAIGGGFCLVVRYLNMPYYAKPGQPIFNIPANGYASRLRFPPLIDEAHEIYKQKP